MPAETFAEAAARVNESRKRDDVKNVADELARLTRYAFPVLAKMAVTDVTTADIHRVFDRAKQAGLQRQTVVHIRQDIANVFTSLKREGSIAASPMTDAELPRFSKTEQRVRAVLTDEELVRYLAFQHPEEAHRHAVLQRQVMSCISRMYGGQRTGDLHGAEWGNLDAEDGRFAVGWILRRKTAAPQPVEIPATLRPILRDWWERAGRPTIGPVFPSLRGATAGQEKTRASHAKALRRDLRRAFGIEVHDWVEVVRVDGRRDRKIRWRQARPLTARERELFEDGRFTRKVDFHSWRRSFSQALEAAGVNLQTSARLTAHASLAAHQRYLDNVTKVQRIPVEALPSITTHVIEPDTVTGHGHVPSGHSGSLLVSPAKAGNTETPSSEIVRHDLARLTSRESQVRALSRLLENSLANEPGNLIGHSVCPIDPGLAEFALGWYLRGAASQLAALLSG
jgi:integrase